MASTGTIIKYSALFLILFSLVGLGVWYFFIDGTTNEDISTPSSNLSACSDGIDNDGDGYIDYRPNSPDGDSGCSSANDFSERDLSFIIWIAVIGVLIAFGFVIYKFWNKKDDKENKAIPEPLSPQRAYELALSDQLKNKFTDIACRIRTEEDGYVFYEPFDEDVIIEVDRESHSPMNIGKTIQYSFISIREGVWRGMHLMVYSLSDGEKGIKGGISKFRSGAWINNYVMKRRDYNLGSPTSEKARLQQLQLEAIKEGDDETIDKAKNLLSSLGSGSAFVDESEEEHQQRMGTSQQSNTKKKGKNTKQSSQGQQPNLDLDGGYEE